MGKRLALTLVLSWIGCTLSGGLVMAQSSECAAIRTACQGAGFTLSGAPGSALFKDCLTPLISGIRAPGPGPLALPTVFADQIRACSAAQSTATGKATTSLLPNTAAVAHKAMPAGRALRPNIVFILADDFSMDLISKKNGAFQQTMPNLAKMQADGASFTHYYVTDSLCCPSRASILTGLLPHNSRVFTNGPPDGGFQGFMAHGDDAKTIAVALHNQFYATALMGKYLNGYQPAINGVPQGWSRWAVAGDGYPNFNYVLNSDGTLIRPLPHLTDEISQLGQDFIKASAAGPFFLELAPFSPHKPYVSPARYASSFGNLNYPKTPAYEARPDSNAPDWLAQIPPLSQVSLNTMQEIYRNRARSDAGIDDMIGAVRQTLSDLGLADNTYVVFTSDNGYHMGEYSLFPGKTTPFDTDIHVPLIVVGPGIAAGSQIDQVAMNIDFYPTFAELAGIAPPTDVDGHSLVGVLLGRPVAWRNLEVIEHKCNAGDPSASDPDFPASNSGAPPTYAAIRLPGAMYVEYLDGEGVIGYYDLKSDPYELHNIGGSLTDRRKKALHNALEANRTCKGQSACWAAQSLTP